MARFLGDTAAIPILDEFNRPFFTTGKLVVQQCKSCGTVQHPPDDVCYNCQSMEFEYPEASGEGTVYSYVVVHNPPSPAWADRVPYPIALVSLDDYPQVRVIGNVVNRSGDDVEIGQKVHVVFEEAQDEETGETLQLAQWEAV